MSRWFPLLFLVLTTGLLATPVRSGVIDLTGADLRSVQPLDGTWDFFPRSLPGEVPPVPLPVPGGWNPALGGADGWGTYTLRVRLPDPVPSDLALSLPLINSAAEVRWNSEVVDRSGVWAGEKSDYRPDRKTSVVALAAHPGDNLLEIRVSNWGDINGGLNEPLRIGPSSELWKARTADVSLAVFLFGCLFVMGVYHFGLFLYRPGDRGPLWFGLLSLLLGVRSLVYGPSVIADLLPSLGWELGMKVGYLTFSASTLFLGLFIRNLFPSVTPRWFRPAILIGAGGYALANLVFPAGWYSPVLPFFQMYAGAVGLVVAFILVQAIRKGLPGANLFLVGFLVLAGSVVNDILKTNFFLPTPNLSSFGLLAFLVFQSLVMLKNFTTAFADSERSTRRLARLNSSLERFIPREVLAFLKKDSIVEVELGDHCLHPMSVLFADIRDFTTLSETMSPEENFKFINSYLRRMGPVVRRHDGFVDKYLGDGIMALFPGEAAQALEAALELREALAQYNMHRAKSGYPPIRMGIGVHRGPLMLGTIGENQRMDSTVISDTVNAASRLEGLTKKFGCDILISGETVDALEAGQAGKFLLDYLGEETVKGRRRPLKVYSLTPKPLGEAAG